MYKVYNAAFYMVLLMILMLSSLSTWTWHSVRYSMDEKGSP